MIRRLILALVLAAIAAGAADAHSLFDPVPRERMRALSTDRPDLTESPYTLDAGHVQLEMDVVNAAFDDAGAVEFEGLGLAATNFKLGLSDRVDLQLVLDVWRRETVEIEGAPSLRSTREGVGDLTARLKVNLHGNDGGRWALALLPSVTLPTASEGLGGDDPGVALAVPLAIDLGGAGLGLMAAIASQDGAHEWLGTAVLGRDLAGALGGFVELTLARTAGDAPEATLATFDTGLTLGLGPDVQLDGGIVVGLTDDTEDVRVFAGLSVRR